MRRAILGLSILAAVAALVGAAWDRRLRREREDLWIDGYSMVVNAVDDCYWINRRMPRASEVVPWAERHGLKTSAPLVVNAVGVEREEGGCVDLRIDLTILGGERMVGTTGFEKAYCGDPGASHEVWRADGSVVVQTEDAGCPTKRADGTPGG